VEFLSADLIKLVRDLSAGRVLTYVEADYFGGEGGQCGVCYANGSEIFPVTYGHGIISQVLRLFGITKARWRFDEFETVGLDKRRRTEDWLRDYKWTSEAPPSVPCRRERGVQSLLDSEFSK
jgi:hypothetical protein